MGNGVSSTDTGGNSMIVPLIQLTAENFFNELLYGSGAFIGHIIIMAVILWIRTKVGMGKLVGLVISVAMMLFMFTTMPPDNDAFILVLGYLGLAVTSITGKY